MNTQCAVTTYAGPAGDHNDWAMRSSGLIGDALSRRLRTANVTIGEPRSADPSWWDVELERARPSLELMARRIDQVMAQGLKPISALTRCAVALATQPVVLRYRPDAVVVWMDAHADLNEPGNTTTGYLGGMALSGVLGWWDSGFGAGVPGAQAVLVGARDLDPAEEAQIKAGRVVTVPVGERLDDRLAQVIEERPVYLHLDCDVLEPGIVQTDYQVAGGLTLQQLAECADALAHSEVIGLEMGEFEGPGTAGADELVEALTPLL